MLPMIEGILYWSRLYFQVYKEMTLNKCAFDLSVCIEFFIICLQGIPDNERRTTKAESAWLFRIWYNFDHKYP